MRKFFEKCGFVVKKAPANIHAQVVVDLQKDGVLRPSQLPKDADLKDFDCSSPAENWTFEDYVRVHDAQQWRKEYGYTETSHLYLLGRRDAFLGRTSSPPRYMEIRSDEDQEDIWSYTAGYIDGLADRIFGSQRVPEDVLGDVPEYNDPKLSAHARANIIRHSIFGALVPKDPDSKEDVHPEGPVQG